MFKLLQTALFSDWLSNLRDTRAKQRIAMRLDRLALGNFGDVKPVGAGVSELRIPVGKGYRVYLLQRGDTVIILLCGGNKKSQSHDIALAKELAKEVKE